MSRKKIITATVLYLLWNVLLYASFAVVIWKTNLSEWKIEQRYLYVGFAWFVGLFIYAFVSINKPK